MTVMTVENWLSLIYGQDKKGNSAIVIGDFKNALEKDAALLTAANQRLNDLDALIKARGEKACAYSTKYRTYLQKALGRS